MPHKRAKQSVRSADRKSKGKDLAPTTQDVMLRDMPKGAMRILNGAKIQEDYNRRKKERAQMSNGGTQPAKKTKEGVAAEPLRIKAGEKMADFSSRVERAMAGEVHATFKATRASSKKRKRKAGAGDDKETDEKTQRLESSQKAAKRAEQEPDSKALRQERARLQSGMATSSKGNANDVERDWQKPTQRKSVNDVVDAPPTLTRAPRGQSSEALKRKAELRQLMQGGDPGAPLDGGRAKARLPNPVQQLGIRRQAELQQERDKAVKAYREAKERRLHETEKREKAKAE